MTTKLSLEEKFRETGGKRTYVQRLFGRIARIYDPMNRLMSFGMDRRWRAFAARRLALGSGEIGLDLGTGTADLSIAVIRHSGPGTRMIGIDITPEMLELGRSKVARSATGRTSRLPGNQSSTRQNFRHALPLLLLQTRLLIWRNQRQSL